MAESFVKTFRRDYLYVNDLLDAVTVMEKLTEWMEDYNNWHPHKGLKMQSPREYRSSLLVWTDPPPLTLLAQSPQLLVTTNTENGNANHTNPVAARLELSMRLL